MSFATLTKSVARALPVIIANVPAAIAAFKAVKRAARGKRPRSSPPPPAE